MKRDIQLVDFESAPLREMVESKLNNLNTYNHSITSAQIFLKEDNDEKVVEINLYIPHRNIFVKKSVNKNEHDFDTVINNCFDVVKRKLIDGK